MKDAIPAVTKVVMEAGVGMGIAGFLRIVVGVAGCGRPSVGLDADLDGWRAEDCDDADAGVHPGALERCDGVDQDCDGRVDEDPTDGLLLHPDLDGDGAGDIRVTVRACRSEAGLVQDASDCDDRDPYVRPGMPERCDGLDQDCDGKVDDHAVDAATWHPDADEDGFGDAYRTVRACERPHGWTVDGSDCEDERRDVHPGAPETCDGRDEDCDGQVDEPWGEDCLALHCEGVGIIHVVPNACMDDYGGSTSEDSLEVYCVAGIARFCLSGEACPWRGVGWTDDGTTCSDAGLVSDVMATAWCDLWEGHATLTCVDGRVGW